MNRYEFDGEAIEVPVCWDRHLRRYVEDCTAYCEQPGYTPAGRPVLLTFEDACPPGRDGGRRPARHRLRRLPTLPSISRLPAGRMQKRKAQKEKAARPQGRPNPKKQGGNMMRKQGERLPGGKKKPPLGAAGRGAFVPVPAVYAAARHGAGGCAERTGALCRWCANIFYWLLDDRQ